MNDDRAPLILDRVRLRLGPRTLLGPLDAHIPPGHCWTLMGPSGSGKSSLLAWLAGTLDVAFTAEGRVCIGERDVTTLPPEQRRIGILFQDDLLFPHLSVGGNLAFALPARIRDRHERRARIEQALADAGLAGHAERDPVTLSGGQRARVALLRTLLAEPDALLLDEPFGKLDHARREDMRRFVFAHVRARGLPTVLVTHDEDDARAALGPVVSLAMADTDHTDDRITR
ncbi:ATP-binding cassette domain-containing protein [Sphaerotilus mobilis]|uniref:Putative thiamine transport system ATP-binding protein n=1 Tax=Sphaerotilus mobilis TaxID=47994 RepID=A0A4Q7LEG0_9BURK|nr:ATP-binding cassette domain-containing protein [Sphaerotilus mobilis]RZS52341.1 putative thiamine transport system ATP-binding protein [Sphaerotilus mobilis]